MNRAALLKRLIAMRDGIQFESQEDEGAAEFYGEVNSVIEVIQKNGTDEEIQKAADWVGINISTETILPGRPA